MKQSEKVIFVLKKKDCSFEEIKKETKIGFFDLQKTIKELLKEEKIFKSGFPTKYSLEKKKHSVMGFTQLKESINPLLKYKEIFLIVTIALILLLVYSVFFKNPFLFPGLEQRTLLALTPLLIITLLLYVPWLKIASFLPTEIISDKVFVHLENAKKIANLVELKKYLKETNKQIIIPYYPHFLIIISVISLLEMPLLKPLNDFFSPIALILIIISVILIILKQKNYSFFKEKNLVKYSFLFLLILVTISSLKFEFLEFIAKPLLEIQFQLTIFTIFLGAITFYQNKQVIEEIEAEQSLEEKEEQKRAKEFDKKYPRLARVPVGKHIFKWMYKEGLWYSTVIFIIILINLFIKLIYIERLPLHGDEGLLILLFYGIENSGIPLLESGRIYLRGFFHSYFSFLLNIFFTTRFSIRFPSVIFSLLIIILFYKITSHYSNKKFGILAAIFISMNPYLIIWSLEGRFYVEGFFWLLLFIYLFFIKNKKNLFVYFILPILAFQASFTNIVIPIIIIISEFKLKFKPHSFSFFKMFLPLILVIIFWKIMNILSNYFMFGELINLSENNSITLNLFLDYSKITFYTQHLNSLNIVLILILISFSLFLFAFEFKNIIYFSKNKNNKKKSLFLIFLLTFGIFLLLIFFSDWYRVRYFLTFYFLIIFILIISYTKLISIFSKKTIFIYIIFFIYLILFSFSQTIPTTYKCTTNTFENAFVSPMQIYNEIKNDNLEYIHSFITGATIAENDDLINIIKKTCLDSKCTLLTTDTYNTNSLFYKEITSGKIKIYILNEYLMKNGYSIFHKGEYFSVYDSRQKYIKSIEHLEYIHSNSSDYEIFLLLKKGRFKLHNSQQIIDYVINNFELIKETKNNVGCINNIIEDGYFLFKKIN